MSILVVIMLLVCIAIPLAYAWRLWRVEAASGVEWLVVALDSFAVVMVILIVGRWDMAGYYLRNIILLAFLLALALSLRRHVSTQWREKNGVPLLRKMPQTLLSLFLIGCILVYALSGWIPANERRNLAFPLQGGTFIVGQGGGNVIINRHSGHAQQNDAADIVALNPLGYRAAGLLPKRLGAYEIYGANVVSPCEGEIMRTRDGLPDLIPPEMDSSHAAGNHIVIDCGDAIVELAHLQPGSITTRAGAATTTGERIAKVGNSGNTSEPHLHVHATDPESGEALELMFDGRLPVRNAVFRR